MKSQLPESPSNVRATGTHEPGRRFIWRVEAGARGTEGMGQAIPLQQKSRHSCRVLVVDDDVLIRAHLCARCVALKLSEAFARQELPATKEPLGGAIKFKLTTMEPASDGGSPESMRALLRIAEGLQHSDRREERRSADTGTVHYLSDFKPGGDVEKGRNWPAS